MEKLRILTRYKYSLAIFVILSSVTGFGEHATEEIRETVSEKEIAENEAAHAVADFIKPFVHRSKKSIDTYHYVKGSELGFPEAEKIDFDSDKVKNHHLQWGNYYWNLSQPLSGHTKGLYLAADPVASYSFGGDDKNWVLYRMTLPKDLLMFDLAGMTRTSDNATYQLPKEVRSLLEKAGCDELKTRTLFRNNISLACRKIALKVMKALGVDVIYYDWVGIKFPGMMDGNDGSFILIHPEGVSPESIAVFTREKSKGNRAEEKAIFSSLAKTMITEEETPGGGKVMYPKPLGLWPELPATTLNIRDWAKKHWNDYGDPLW